MNRITQTNLTLKGLGCADAVMLMAGSIGFVSLAGANSTAATDAYADLPASITLTGTVRDFRERSVEGGHQDFQRRPSSGFGQYLGMVEDDRLQARDGIYGCQAHLAVARRAVVHAELLRRASSYTVKLPFRNNPAAASGGTAADRGDL